MAIYGYTKNYKLIKPEYDSDTWHDYEYDNLDTIDAVLSSIFASGNWKGFWANNTAYAVGDVVIDRDLSQMYQVLVAHTTDSDSTFSAYRTANPAYYQEWNANKLAKDWANKTDGSITDLDVTDYSSKAYAIGGVGTETNNSKYYSQQASASEAVATTKASEASASASAAATSESNAKASELNAKQSEVNAKASETVAKAAQDDPNVVAVGTNLRATDSSIKKVAADMNDVSAVAMIDNEVVTVSSAINQVVTVAGIKDQVVTTAEHATAIQQIGDNIQTVLNAPQDAEKSRVYAYGTDAEVQALGGEHSAKGWAEKAQVIAQISDATESVYGVVRLATEAEALAGVNDTKAMTPLKTSQSIAANVGRGLQLGFNGTLTGNVLTFEPDQSAYEMKQGYDYEIDLLFPAAGVLPDDTQMVITNGSDTVQIVNVRHADASSSITYGDMKQICRYDAEIGWRWVFNARYAVTDTGVKVLVMPSYAFQDDRYVTTDTAQNINAGKNFINNATSTDVDSHTSMSICLKNSDAELGANTQNEDGTVNFKYQGIRVVDKNNEEISSIYSAPDGVGGSFTRLSASAKVDDQYVDGFVELEVDANGKTHFYVPDVDEDSTVNGTQAVTKKYVDGDQTITGTKTLTNPVAFKYKLPISRDAAPETNQSYRLCNFVDANDNLVGLLGFTKKASGEVSLRLQSRNNTVWSGIEIINTGTAGSSYINIGNPPDSVSGAEAITAAWAIKNLTYVSLPTAANMVSMTIGASGTQYTAPDNGWFAAYANGDQSNACRLTNTTTGVMALCSAVTNLSDGCIFIPARKGETVVFNYTGSLKASSAWIRFYRGGTNNVI